MFYNIISISLVKILTDKTSFELHKRRGYTIDNEITFL